MAPPTSSPAPSGSPSSAQASGAVSTGCRLDQMATRLASVRRSAQ